MEEIIASISRLIADDKAVDDRLRPGFGDKDDILDLTDAIDEDGSARRVVPAPGVAAAAEATASGARIEPEPPGVSPGTVARDGERIISGTTAEATAAAFSRLGEAPRPPRGESEKPSSGGARTLEEIARESLRPLLQAWLDEHLPALVERLVREEIARVSGAAGLR